MVNFADLKKNRQQSIDKLTNELQKMNTNSSKTEDNRFWTPTVDKAGNGSATIRFLPATEENGVFFVRIFDHAFKGPTGKWYIENSLSTLGRKDDPCGAFNSKLWNMSNDDDSPERKQVREQKRRLHYISNIYVVKDPANPENEGKVFLFKYGKKIFDKLNDLMMPSDPDDEKVYPYDLWEGANFRLKIRQVSGYRNYDKSDFANPAPLSDDDSELEKIFKSEYALQEFIDPSKFKSVEELQKRLNEVLELDTTRPARPARPAPRKSSIAEDLDDDEIPPFDTKPKVKKPVVEDDEDEFDAHFKKLIADDEDFEKLIADDED